MRRSGKLRLLVTQNVDGLHQAAGHPEGVSVSRADEYLLEVHGSFARVQCLYCFTKHPTRRLLREYRPPEPLEPGGDPCGPASEPRCPRCSGMLKPDVVLFGEALPEGAMDRALGETGACDLLLCVGTTLAVAPVNEMVPRAKAAGASVVILNGSPTEMDHLADVFVEAPISEALPVLTGYDELLDGGPDGDAARAGPEEGGGAGVGAPAWEDHGFAAWLPAEQLAGMDRAAAEAWMYGGLPDWPPAVCHGGSHPVFRRVGLD